MIAVHLRLQKQCLQRCMFPIRNNGYNSELLDKTKLSHYAVECPADDCKYCSIINYFYTNTYFSFLDFPSSLQINTDTSTSVLN